MESVDTIVALSTATGVGAIGIVRLSGPDAVRIAAEVFRPARPVDLSEGPSHVARYGRIVDPATHRTVDEALALVMRAPGTYTREDVVELQCHGGPASQRAVLRLLLSRGARPAEPGEFTKRAFLNGRIDLTQAESVAATVRARSAGALRVAVRQLEGGLAAKVRELRGRLIDVLAAHEVGIDFSDEDVDEVEGAYADGTLREVEVRLAELLTTALLGRALEHGVSTAIVGRPNVGKSSLLNALLMRERAIVSEIPGTTRDTVEELVEVAGIPLHLVDTAGLRHSDDHVEKLGIERSRRALEQADLVLAVLDLSEGVTAADRALLQDLPLERTIIVGNKSDLAGGDLAAGDLPAGHLAGVLAALAEIDGWATHGRLGQDRLCAVSAVTGAGIDSLRDAIEGAVVGDGGLHLDEPILATERQRALVEEALEGVRAARAGLFGARPEELVCEDLRGAAEALGRITGEELVPDLIDTVFSTYCIGK